jgi:hypothetical protein
MAKMNSGREKLKFRGDEGMKHRWMLILPILLIAMLVLLGCVGPEVPGEAAAGPPGGTPGTCRDTGPAGPPASRQCCRRIC